MSAAELLVACLVVAAGAAVQGGVGFGMNLIAAPLLALIDPDLVPGPAIAAAVLLTVLLAVRERASIDGRAVGFALIGRVPGTTAGALLIGAIPERGVALTVAAGVFLAVLLNVGRPRLRPTPKTLLAAGVVSGFGSTTSSIGGPPMAVVFANEPGPVVRANLSAIFVVGGLMSIVGLALVGDFGRKEALASLLLLVPGGVGFLASRRLASHLDAGRTRAGVLAVSLAGAVLVVAKELV